MLSTFCFLGHGGEVTLIKQWHLSPNVKTLNIVESQKFPQAINQVEIYKTLSKQIEENKIDVVISEGCEGEINENFELAHNGWNYQRLKSSLSQKNYENILALIPLKLKVKFGSKVIAVCGDSNELIKKHQLAFSEAKGYLQYYDRLTKYQKNNSKKFKAYAKSLLKGNKGKDPIEYARKSALEQLNLVERFIDERNKVFANKIATYKDKRVAVVIGGIHVSGLVKLLNKKGTKAAVVAPKGYNVTDEQVLATLKEILAPKLELFQMPVGFSYKEFPIGNLVEEKEIASDQEWKELKRLSAKLKFPIKLLQSDYDKDGIRDFTISSSGQGAILSAEDSDWDNDGEINLLDNSVGKIEVAAPVSNRVGISNIYEIPNADVESISKKIEKRGIKLATRSGVTIDYLVLTIFDQLLERLSFVDFDVKLLVATAPVVIYGQHSFFAYIPQSKCIEVYSDKLNRYVLNLIESKYKGASVSKVVNQVVIPILVHSLAHELGHSYHFDYNKLAKSAGWSWEEVATKSIYLQQHREPSKVISKLYKKFRYKGMSKDDFYKEKKEYETFVNKMLSGKKDFIESAVKSSWYTGTKSKQREYQLSLLKKVQLPTYYSITNLSEWFAEVFSACSFKLVVPGSEILDQSTRYELLIGLRTDVVDNRLCKQLGFSF